MKAASENGITRVLWLACAALIAAMALNAPTPNGQGGWRDQFIEGWRQAQLDVVDPVDEQGPAEVAGATAQVGR